jgi:hypothetical protein
MNNEKVVIPREVAEAIESVREVARASNEQILEARLDGSKWFCELYTPLMEDVDFDTLVRALYNGYIAEQTPEEKVLEYFRSHETCTPELVDRYIGICKGVVDTLNLLGIKIEGVNA